MSASGGPSTPAELAQLRADIEALDCELIRLLARRVHLARAVGEAKRAADIPTLDPAREAAVVRRAAELARESGLCEDDVRCIFWQLIGISRRAQMEE